MGPDGEERNEIRGIEATRPIPLIDREGLRQKIGSRLILAAWAVEIIAAAIGLFIALATAYATRSEIMNDTGVSQLDAAGWLSVFIGALPFIMVAVVELMKIPLATATFISYSRIWRIAFGASLALLIIVTFETMMNGFQRNFEDRLFAVSQLKTKLLAVDSSVQQTEQEKLRLSQLSPDVVQKEYDSAREEIRRNRDSQLQEIENLRRTVSADSVPGTSSALQTSVQRLNDEIKTLRDRQKTEIEQQEDAYRRESERVSGERGGQQQVIEARISNIERQIGDLIARRDRELQNCFFSCDKIRADTASQIAPLQDQKAQFARDLSASVSASPSSNLRRTYDERISQIRKNYEDQISRLDTRLTEATQQLDRRQNQGQAQTQPQIQALDRRRADVVARLDTELKEAKDRYDQRMLEVTRRERTAADLDKKLAELERDGGNLRNSVNEKARANQIYQIAALIYGKESPSEVTKDEIKWVSLLWFGSLALIVAVTGTILAFAGLVIRYGQPHDASKYNSLRIRVNRRLIGLVMAVYKLPTLYRRRLQEPKIRFVEKYVEVPKEVVKEVPVDKVVFKEVPKEVVRKELVYVPFYTSDKRLLAFQEKPDAAT